MTHVRRYYSFQPWDIFIVLLSIKKTSIITAFWVFQDFAVNVLSFYDTFIWFGLTYHPAIQYSTQLFKIFAGNAK